MTLLSCVISPPVTVTAEKGCPSYIFATILAYYSLIQFLKPQDAFIQAKFFLNKFLAVTSQFLLNCSFCRTSRSALYNSCSLHLTT